MTLLYRVIKIAFYKIACVSTCGTLFAIICKRIWDKKKRILSLEVTGEEVHDRRMLKEAYTDTGVQPQMHRTV